MSFSPKIFFVFDVESVGLHGEGFAVGFVVVDREGNKLDQGLFACPLFAASGQPDNFEWCKKNIPAFDTTHNAPWLVRAAFWRKWQEWKEKEAVMVSDCGWPVEARFLAACVDDNPLANQWTGPYPLYDLSSVLLTLGINPVETMDRISDEFPQHNPLADAKQSARILIENLNKIKITNES